MLSSKTRAFLAAAAVLFAGSAGAYTTWTAGDTAPERVTPADAADDSVSMTEAVEIRIDPEDFIIGRTTGFQVRFNLRGGPSGSEAVFDAVPVLVAGADLPAGWNVSLGAGGQVGDNFLVVNFNPPGATPTTGLVDGEIARITGIALGDVEELLVEGSVVSGQTFFADPISSIMLSRENVDLLESGNPVVLACDAGAGDTAKRIDVADTSGSGGFASKTAFSADGSLGGAETMATEAGRFDFGNLAARVDPTFASFGYASTDAFTATVRADAGSTFDAFTSMFLSADDCTTSVLDGVVDGGTATFDYTLADLGASGTAAGYTLALCGLVDNATVIDDAAPVTVTTTFRRPSTALARTATCDVLPLQYNGSVVEVFHVNPAGNPTAQSFLRIVNRSDTDGWVQLDGIDDAGDGAALDGGNRVRFFLRASRSVQFNSEDLENGNATKGLVGAWGDGTGKWRAVITAEFPGARVQALNRNTVDDTVTNLTDSDSRGSQALEGASDNGP